MPTRIVTKGHQGHTPSSWRALPQSRKQCRPQGGRWAGPTHLQTLQGHQSSLQVRQTRSVGSSSSLSLSLLVAWAPSLWEHKAAWLPRGRTAGKVLFGYAKR